MKLFKITSVLFLLTSLIVFSGCDVDDDKLPPPQKIKAYLTKYGNVLIRYNKENKPISMLDQQSGEAITINYDVNSSKPSLPKTVEVAGTDKSYTMYLTYGDNGLLSEVQKKHNETLLETWNFRYNTRSTLNTIEKSKGDKNVQINLIYVGADILSIDEISNGENNNIATFKYVEDFNDKVIENRGRLLFLEEMTRMDFDGIKYLSYMKLLGYGGYHLPRKGNVRGMVLEYDWEFNLYGLPTELEIEINDAGKEKKAIDWRVVPMN